MDFAFLVFLVPGIQCISTSQWSLVSRQRDSTVGGFWNSSNTSLIQCVQMCLHSTECKAVGTESATKPRARLCVFLKHRSPTNQEPSPEDLLVFVPRQAITDSTPKNPPSTFTTTEVTNKASPSTHENTFGIVTRGSLVSHLATTKKTEKQYPDLAINLSGLVVIQQYNHRQIGNALHTLDTRTWTFKQHRMTVESEIINVVFDPKTNLIYRVEYAKISRDITVKSTSLKTLDEIRLFEIPHPSMVDINIDDNGLYVVTETFTGSILIKRELVYTGSMEHDKILFTFPQDINVDRMQSLNVDPIRNKLYWHTAKSRKKVLLYMADFSMEHAKPVQLELQTRGADLYPFTELYWADDQGVLSVADFERNVSRRVARCGIPVKSTATVGRHNRYWYLTCYTGINTRIRVYDGKMKFMKELQVKFKGIVASE